MESKRKTGDNVIYETQTRVRYGETDQMGVVYHPNYYLYFEIGRTEFLRNIGGISYKDMEDSGILMPIIETHCKYFMPAGYDDILSIFTWIKTLSVVRITFSHKIIRKADETLLVEGETSLAFINKEGRPVNMKKNNKELYEKLLAFIK